MITDKQISEDIHTLDQMLQRSLKHRSSEEFVRFFNFIARFDHYSRYNCMLVYIQNPAVTFFGSESYWKKKFQRTIKEDARPLIILAPKHPVLLAYDIFDTEGRITPEQLLKDGVGKLFEFKGSISSNTLNSVINQASNWGIKVSYKPLSFFNLGYINTVYRAKLEICLKDGLTNEESFSVLIHELAHLMLGHTGHKEIINKKSLKKVSIEVRGISLNTEELEAESVSYLICYKLKLETRSAEYIAGYIKDQSILWSFSYETVIRTADRIENIFL